MTHKTHGGPRTGSGKPRHGELPKVLTSISIDTDLLDEARRHAAARGISLSAYVEAALRDRIELEAQ